MPSQVERLQGHAGHLLDGLIGLREKYALLDPMLFDAELVTHWGGEKRSRGFEILRSTLFLTCVQDIAKLSVDSDDRAPSVKNFIDALANTSLRNELREHYAVWHLGEVGEKDPIVVAAIKQMELREQAKRRAHFDSRYQELLSMWGTYCSSTELDAFVKIRDKLSAHTDVHYFDGKYVLLDVRKLGLKWGDLKGAVTRLQALGDLINALVRSASFAWDMLDEQLAEAVTGFWEKAT